MTLPQLCLYVWLMLMSAVGVGIGAEMAAIARTQKQFLAACLFGFGCAFTLTFIVLVTLGALG